VKGVVFNLLEKIVVRDHGDETWELLLDRTELEGVYTPLIEARGGGERLGAQLGRHGRELSLEQR
jgi:hypothetical protein